MTSTPQVADMTQPDLRNDPEIPTGLDPREIDVYKTLLGVRERRAKPPPDVFVITDIAKDYDDLVAMILLKELQRLGLIRLRGFIANLKPSKDRAVYGRGALDSLGLQGIPIAWGEDAMDSESSKTHKDLPHEFLCRFNVENCTFTPLGKDKANVEDPLEIESGTTLLQRCVLENAIEKDKKAQSVSTMQKVPPQGLTFLLISSLKDISTYIQSHEKEFMEGTARVVLQGGYKFSDDKFDLEVDATAANNKCHLEAAKHFHSFLAEREVPSIAYTKIAASAAGLPPKFFEELKNTGHVLGVHLLDRQVKQELAWYAESQGPNPPLGKNQENYLRIRTTWYDDPQPKPEDKKPEGAEILQIVKVILYDVLAALDTAGEDVIEALGVLTESQEKQGESKEYTARHRIVGSGVVTSDGPLDTGINVDNMKVALTALLKGSLLSAVEKGFGVKENYSQTTESGESGDRNEQNV